MTPSSAALQRIVDLASLFDRKLDRSRSSSCNTQVPWFSGVGRIRCPYVIRSDNRPGMRVRVRKASCEYSGAGKFMLGGRW